MKPILSRVAAATVVSFTAASFLAVALAEAACPPSCANPGGRNDETVDCLSEFASPSLELNSPFYNPNKPKAGKEVRCHDGEPACDLDGEVNNSCTFSVDICLRNEDPALPSCTPADVSAVAVSQATKIAELGNLQSAADALLPATTNVCTADQSLTVPLKGPNGKGVFKAGKGKLKLEASTAAASDKDQLKLVCVPHDWPHHGYDSNNRRSSPLATGITADNVGSLVTKFTYRAGGPVTSTPTVDAKQIYISSWDGRVTAVSRKTGKSKWAYNTGAPGGVQSSVTLTADGRVVVGDSSGKVHALSAKKGELLWIADAGDTDPAAAHLWGSPTVAAGKVFVGRASHNDQPCSPGTVYAFDLDTGAEVWRYQTVPDGVCYDDTTIECSGNGDCGATSPCSVNFCARDKSVSCTLDSDCTGLFFNSVGPCVTSNACTFDVGTSCTTNADCPSCVEISGGGVTAAPAVSADGETVYVVTVGCLSEPSVGNSDSIIALDAATGSETWVHRTRAVEQVADGPPYHDYGFLNGPILANVDDGFDGEIPVVAAASKDGTLYAVDPADGTLVWSREVAPAPEFAGFGLFNGAPGFADGNFFAALYQFTGWPGSNDHIFAFDGSDGSTLWSEQIGASWGDVTIAGGVVYAGTTSSSNFFAFDQVSGTLLNTFALPDSVAGGAAVVDDQLIVPYGIIGDEGGIRVYGPAD